MNLAYKCYTERIDMIDTVLNNTMQLFASAESPLLTTAPLFEES